MCFVSALDALAPLIQPAACLTAISVTRSAQYNATVIMPVAALESCWPVCMRCHRGMWHWLILVHDMCACVIYTGGVSCCLEY